MTSPTGSSRPRPVTVVIGAWRVASRWLLLLPLPLQGLRADQGGQQGQGPNSEDQALPLPLPGQLGPSLLQAGQRLTHQCFRPEA
jgi:hypothetical protein